MHMVLRHYLISKATPNVCTEACTGKQYQYVQCPTKFHKQCVVQSKMRDINVAPYFSLVHTWCHGERKSDGGKKMTTAFFLPTGRWKAMMAFFPLLLLPCHEHRVRGYTILVPFATSNIHPRLYFDIIAIALFVQYCGASLTQ